MITTLAIAIALSQTPQHRLFMQPNLPRTTFAFFEVFPASGAGTSGVCSTTAPTGAKGEVLTFTRASTATCTTGGYGGRTSSIANGALVELSSNILRVESDPDGVVSALIESSRVNVLPRFIDYANAAWADVGTPTLTGGQTSPFTGTYASSAVQFDDNDGVAFEGRTQTVTVSAAAAYTMHCYVKAGTIDQARITLDGTAATITGLSSSTWSIIEVTDASTSGVAVAAQVMVGDATGDTGTVFFGGCQVEPGSYRTSIIPTVAATVTRNADGPATFAGSLTAMASTGCSAATVTPHTSASTTGGLIIMNGAGRPLYLVGTLRMYDGTTEPTLAAGLVAHTAKRYRSTWTGATQTLFNVTDATSNSGAFDGTMDTTGPLAVGASATIGLTADYRVSRVKLDPSTGGCP